MITRRDAFYLGLGTLIASTVSGGKLMSRTLTQPQSTFSRSFPISTHTSLAERAKAKKLYYGSSVIHHHLFSDPEYANCVTRECNIVTPEWELKWSNGPLPLRPTPYTFDFTLADAIVEFAENHKLLIRGHTLVWHWVPDWFKDVVDHYNAEQFLIEHIDTVVRHYAGRIHSWDVVNEAVEPQDGRADNLRESLWLELLGKDYIDLAFRVAAEADPTALLVYNEYGLEYDTPADEAKRIAVLKLLENLKNQGTPISGFGLQSHLFGHETRFNAQKLRTFLADVASLGLKILVTEMDVVDQELSADIAERDQIVSSAYEDYLNVVLDEPAVIAVITWGLSDRYTWLSQFSPREDGLPVRPLPLDSQLNRKLAWNAIARAFDNSSKR